MHDNRTYDFVAGALASAGLDVLLISTNPSVGATFSSSQRHRSLASREVLTGVDEQRELCSRASNSDRSGVSDACIGDIDTVVAAGSRWCGA